MATWRTGNAGEDTSLYRGWLVGHFIDTDDLRYSRNVEVKWGVHAAGDERTEWSPGVHERTILILVTGRWRLDLAANGRRSERNAITLNAPGDYAVWDKGVDHRWRAEQDSVVITIR